MKVKDNSVFLLNKKVRDAKIFILIYFLFFSNIGFQITSNVFN